LKNAFVVFVVAWLAFGNEARSEDVGGLKLNQSTVGLLTSEPGRAGNMLEITNAVDHTDGLRERPIIGRGSLQSINGLLFLRSVDVALLSSDSLAYVKQNKLYKDETGKLAYLAKLANMNVIILARKEIGVNEELPGMRIATGPANGDEFIADELVLGALGTNYGRVATTGKNSLAALLDGRIDAAVFTRADSHTLLNSIRANGGLAFSIQAAGSQ
jgi:uncharacterized protein